MASASRTAAEIKLEKLCRTCLSSDNELFSLFEEYTNSHTLDYIVAETTGLQIHKNDGLPATICNLCKKKATQAYQFKRASQEAEASLKGILTNIKNEPAYKECVPVKDEPDTYEIEIDDTRSEDYNIPSMSGTDLRELEGAKVKGIQSSDFMCKGCSAGFKTSAKLEVHTLFCQAEIGGTNNADDTLCPICGLRFEDTEILTKHTWENHPEVMGRRRRGRRRMLNTAAILAQLQDNGFNISRLPLNRNECKFCHQLFDTKEQVIMHTYGHNDTKVLRCTPCKKAYLEKSHFDAHNCVQDITDSTSQDTDSSNTAVSASLESKKHPQFLETEIRLQDLLPPDSDMDVNVLQVCTACSCVVTTEAELNAHRDDDHPELSLRCNLCAKVFASLRSAARHRSLCRKLEKRYRCSTCGLKFAYEISLNKHILKSHEGESVSVDFMKPKKEKKQFECDTCSKSFDKKELLEKHTKTHSASGKTYDCDVCEKKFQRKDNLRSHKRTHELGTEKVKKENDCLCLFCGRSFSNSSNMIVHIRRHTGDKPYKCDICNKGFPRSSDLHCHRRTHTGEKPCICSICGKAFSRSNKLSRHMRVHTGQKPYKCLYCDKSFTQSNDLNLHKRRHTGDRPYTCNVCNEAFIQGTALQNHRRAHGHYLTPPDEPPAEVQPQTYTVHTINNNNR